MKTAIHIGSASIDDNSHTQQECNDIISAITANIPNTDYVVIGTYLDYATEIGRWATAIHNAGKKMILRSAGYNDWGGTNSVAKYTSADWETHALDQQESWLDTNYALFTSGDVFSPIPDEPENNSLWVSTYGTIGSGTGKTAYNSFITTGISNAEAVLTARSVTGVIADYVHASPSVSKDVITDATANVMTALGPDSYPEGSRADVDLMNRLFYTQVVQYMNRSYPHHVTFGPNVNIQLDKSDQAKTLDLELFSLQKQLGTNLEGVCIWQFGNTANDAKSRLFDYISSAWTAREACSIVNKYFGSLRNGTYTFKRRTLS